MVRASWAAQRKKYAAAEEWRQRALAAEAAWQAGAGASENKRARLREMEQAMQQKELELRQAARPATIVPVSTREYP